MPISTVSCIYSFSSEDPLWPASNLLTKISKKWRCKTAGEKKAHVCFQLDKPSQITGLDIGNEHSAYITVLVGRKGARDEEFQEILFATGFMTSAESRNSTNVNRVRFFHKEALIESVACEKWELVKVICTQPYNHHHQFGLSFVKLHVLADMDSTNKAKPLVPESFIATSSMKASSVSPFAKLKLRVDSTDSESDTSNSLFNRWKQSKLKDSGVAAGSSTAGSIRDSASPAFKGLATKPKFSPKFSTTPIPKIKPDEDNGSEVDEEKPKRVDRNRMAIMYDSDDEKPNEKLDKKLNHDREKAKASDSKNRSCTAERTSEKFKDFLDTDTPTQTSIKTKPKTLSPIVKQNETSSTPNGKAKLVDRFSPIASTSARKRPHSPGASGPSTETPIKKNKPDSTPATKKITYKPFGKLLEGVVLVISGIQNPDRGHIRDNALKMGAKYKPDWDDRCTHLICAFKNTPKYNQVHGSGKIIKKDWVEACYKAKKRIPWRRFALDPAEKVHPESEDEIEDISRQPKAQAARKKPPQVKNSINLTHDDDETDDEVAIVAEMIPESSSEPEDDDRYNEKSDYRSDKVDKIKNKRTSRNAIYSSGSDTEDEMDLVVRRKAEAEKTPKPTEPKQADDVYDKTTDDEKPTVAKGSNADRIMTPLPEFYCNKAFYISANVSSVETIKLNRFVGVYGGTLTTNAAEANYIISNKAKNLPADFEGEVVKPLWVFECNDLECLLPTKRYLFD